MNHEGTKDTKKTGWRFGERRNVRARQDLQGGRKSFQSRNFFVFLRVFVVNNPR
jgi:hypothetical protein